MLEVKRSFAEFVLALFAGRERAAVIYGDLTEMAAGRGSLWLAAAYVRTLVSLGWRMPVAFLCAYGFSTWVALGGFPTVRSLLRLFLRVAPHSRPRAAIWHVADRIAHHPAPQAVWHLPLGDAIIALWFLLPFVVVRFGLRDRLAQLATALFVVTMPFFSLDTAGMKFAAIASAAIVLAALGVRAWRRPMIVLAASTAPIALAIFVSPRVWDIFLFHGYSFASPQLQTAMAVYRAVEISLAVLMCSFFYGRLLQGKAVDRSTVA